MSKTVRSYLKMAETLGSLIDKLTIVNIKVWHLEEIRNAKDSIADEKRLEAADNLTILNRHRNELVQEIDEFLRDTLSGKKKRIVNEKIRVDK